MSYLTINSLLSLKEGNKTELIENLFADYDQFVKIREECKRMEIDLPFIYSLSEVDYPLLKGKSDVKIIESLLHLPVEKQLDEFSEKLNHQTIYIYLEQNQINGCWNIEEQIEDGFVFKNPCKALEKGIYYYDLWPMIIKIDQDKETLYKINTVEDFYKIKEGNYNEFEKKDQFYFQLGDIHLGPKGHNLGTERLKVAIAQNYALLPEGKHPFLIVGDLMNSPSKRNTKLARNFLRHLKKTYHSDVTFIFGNHDMIVMGLNLFNAQRTKAIAYLSDENIKVLENEKVILIKMNSSLEGNLARGKIGQWQFEQLDEELSTIENIEDYTLIVLVHHHLYVAHKREFIKLNWNEGKIIGGMLNTSKALIDAKELKQWCKKHQIHYVFHGHKHIPGFVEEDGISAVGCGSSSGAMREKNNFSFMQRDRKIFKYLSYNLIRYDLTEKKMKNCLIYYVSDQQKMIEVYRFHN